MLGKHPFGIYEKAFDPAQDWETRLKKAAALGFDYLEISIDEQDSRLERLAWSAAQRRELRELCADLGVPLRSMCLSAHRRFPFGSADPALRARARDVTERALEFAGDLGIRVIQLAGYDVYYEPSTAESVRRFREGLCWATEKAARAQVMLGMEIMDTPFLCSASKYMETEKLVRNPWYGVYPDLGNLSAWPENDVDRELALGLRSMVACHVKDTLRVTERFPGKFKGVEFGSGCVDFPHVFRTLESLGYAGPYLMERWFQPGGADTEQIAASKRYVEAVFAAGTEDL